MTSPLDRLLEIAGVALATPGRPRAAAVGADRITPVTRPWAQRDGFHAFESALYVHPLATGAAGERSMQAWNEPALWRAVYDDLAAEGLCFAEDVFGGQFVLLHGEVSTFDPETGARDWLAPDLEGWAEAVLDDYAVLTGHPLAHAWQAQHGPLQAGQRLVPKIPFVLGGEFTVENLHALDAVEGMRRRGALARQLRDLPDGARVTYRVVD
ncbi:SMI1/KNR4 family protein [Egicoccus sp. AB-alg2]|uniref:SMI1/KNR4 family protein n=1 Tax=Egicoccus sp. AB-alg2 TaxID=3242693 RepID=UPI00359EE254